MKNNFTAVAAPTATDDASQGYTPGSRWIDVLTAAEYVCESNSRGAALWVRNYATGLQTIAGLGDALVLPQTPSRTVLIERFEQKPVLDVTIDPTPENPTLAEFDAVFAANRNFEVAGANMTAALSTQNVARMGARLATAGATNDQAILRPRTNPAGATKSFDCRYQAVAMNNAA